jgi:hypothetical protein
VMMTASTPSVKASRRCFSMDVPEFSATTSRPVPKNR